MGVKAQTEMLMRGVIQNNQGSTHNENMVQAQANHMQKFMYNLSSAKYLKGLQLMYRQKEYFFWFQSNINYLIQFYTLWRTQPADYLMKSRQQWYEYTEEKEDIQMVHAPVASFITTMLRDLVFSGPVGIVINDNEELNKKLQKAFAEDENDIQNFLKRADMLDSVGGTTLYKCNYDPSISEYPILEVYELPKIDYVEKFGRITGLITVDNFYKDNKEYALIANHTRKGIEYSLWSDSTQVDMSEVYSISDMPCDILYGYNDNGKSILGPILAAWKVRNTMSKEFYDMKLGASDYEACIDSFQMLDEIYSRFINQIRATQPVLFMSEELMGYKTQNGHLVVNTPQDLGCKVIPMSGGVSKIDGKSIAAMFNRDVPDLTGIKELSAAFEWVLRTILVLKGIAPISGNIDTANIGSNTTGNSLFKREQSTHLLRKNLVGSWQSTIKNIVRLMCQWFEIVEARGADDTTIIVPKDYSDLSIDVNFPDIDMDDFQSNLDQAISSFTAGLFDIEFAVKHAFKGKMSENDMTKLVTNLKTLKEEQEKQAAENASKSNSEGEELVKKADAAAKMAKAKVEK